MTQTAAAPPTDQSLIQRHYPWVRAAALRQVRDPTLADDVAQAVFIVMMRKRPSLPSDAAVAGWLFQTTRYAAAHALRSQRRRAYHEAKAARSADEMRTNEPPPSDEWDAIAPLLDESVARLRNEDREAVLLRFYQQKTFNDVGAAMGISAEAARKRVDRAIEKLRDALIRRGVAVPASSALATTLMTHATPPLAIAPVVSAAAAGGAAQIAKGIAMTWTPEKFIAVTIVAVAAVPVVATVGYLALGTHATTPPLAQPAASAAPVAVVAGATDNAATPSTPTTNVSQTDPIIPNDLLSVAISDLIAPGVETIKQCRVDPGSNISLPLVGAVTLKGMVLAEAELAVQSAYRKADLMPNAQVRIVRIESGKAPSARSGPAIVGDFLHIEIADLVGPGVMTTITDRVPDAGLIEFPQAGPLKVKGMSEVEIEQEIHDLYRRKNLLPNAQVTVQRITEQAAKGQPRVQDRKAGR